jgi:hypothetical protein
MMFCSAFSLMRPSSLVCLGLLIAVAEIVPALISLSLISLFRAVFVVGFD